MARDAPLGPILISAAGGDRDLTLEEWAAFIGPDVPYEPARSGR